MCRSVLRDQGLSLDQWNGYRQSLFASLVCGVDLCDANALTVCIVSGDMLVWSSCLAFAAALSCFVGHGR